MSSLVPKNAEWVKDSVVEFKPDDNSVKLADGRDVKYKFLVVAVGIQLDFNRIKGLEEALEKDPTVLSNYSVKTVNKTWPAIKEFNGGNAIFTQPVNPIKCAGAPQKIAYLAEDAFHKCNGHKNMYYLFSN